jgi:hypothetical protein
MDQQAFNDVVLRQVYSFHATGFVHVCEAPLDSFSTLPEKPQSAIAANPSSVLRPRICSHRGKGQ